MTEHFAPDELARFVAGTLARDRSRSLVRHLLLGCPRCSIALARIGGVAPDEMSAPAYEDVVSRAVEQASGTVVARREAVVILTSLLSGERAWNDLSGAETATLRGLPQVRALLDVGFSLRHQDPQAMLRFARLARYAADRLSTRELGVEAVADLRALAWAELGNAYRVCDDLGRSSRAMNRAVYWSNRGSRSSLLLARVADLLASLLGAQRRCSEARQLLTMVYETHRREERPHLAGMALFSAANMAAWDGAPGEAIVLMLRGLELLDLDRYPALPGQAFLAIITFLAELGRYRAARRALWRVRHLIIEHGNSLDLVRLRWLEGKIYAGLGDYLRAESALRETRAGFAEHGQVYPAALAGLSLAVLWARQGRLAEIHTLAGEMIATFRSMRIAREAIVTLLILQKACAAGGGQLLDIIEMVVSFLKDLERQPAKRSDAGSS